jgi:hypothetical protein
LFSTGWWPSGASPRIDRAETLGEILCMSLLEVVQKTQICSRKDVQRSHYRSNTVVVKTDKNVHFWLKGGVLIVTISHFIKFQLTFCDERFSVPG